jgi:hypothetical protein
LQWRSISRARASRSPGSGQQAGRLASSHVPAIPPPIVERAWASSRKTPQQRRTVYLINCVRYGFAWRRYGIDQVSLNWISFTQASRSLSHLILAPGVAEPLRKKRLDWARFAIAMICPRIAEPHESTFQQCFVHPR